MKTTLYTHAAALAHEVPEDHAERPARLTTILDALKGEDFRDLQREGAPPADRTDLLRIHTPAYVHEILHPILGPGDLLPLDPDTWVSRGSAEAASRAAGACVRAVEDAILGHTEAAFVAMRPPGHHALPDAAMGFCLFSNVAIAARSALDEHGLARVAIVDFDVHHGNGTQKAMWDEDRALFISLHQADHYPHTGSARETGAHGNVLNLPFAAGTSAAEWMREFRQTAMPALENFAPELLLVSAGFDAHTLDPLADLHLRDEDYGQIGEILAAFARARTKSRLVSTLEGGYHLSATGRSAACFVRALLAG